MTKNTRFNEIKLAMKAGHYANLNKREEKIYKGFMMAAAIDEYYMIICRQVAARVCATKMCYDISPRRFIGIGASARRDLWRLSLKLRIWGHGLLAWASKLSAWAF